tara:strand:- start:136 stop:1077 length:942 start_codon:yes stop_codon:yes gene_type:complete
VINIKKKILALIILCVSLTSAKTEIKDSIFATIGNTAVTTSDIVSEIKIILLLNGKTFTEDARDELQSSAIKSIIKRTVKKIEIKKYSSLDYSKKDLSMELENIANDINMDVDTLKDICAANEIDFDIVVDQIKTELLWNSLIFDLYKNRISINEAEINEQLSMIESKKNEKIDEYLISEIIIKNVPKEEMQTKIVEIKKRIENEGFEKVASDISISETSSQGGDLGWIKKNEISEEFALKVESTKIGDISEPIFLTQGLLIFKVRDKRRVNKITNLELAKDNLINSEKAKILNMHSIAHFDKIRRSISINYF